jgi:wyosine [tRNA(Phe)-imidazoG37] synthetase (radical SAM superfamily)
MLESELRGFLNDLLHGDFMQARVPEGMRRINDIALSGNGEPTSAAEFAGVVELIARVRRESGLPEDVKTVLITNGSLLYREDVQRGLRELAKINGELWFKLDRASESGMQAVNDTRIALDKVRANLILAISACPTWLQTCWFALDGIAPTMQDEEDYLEFVAGLLREGHRLQGVLLYGLARPSLQPEAARLSNLPEDAMQQFADRIRSLGVEVRVTA